FFFFFSSRRRHTRSKRDWSSDVCSSDLVRSSRCVDDAPVRRYGTGPRDLPPTGDDDAGPDVVGEPRGTGEHLSFHGSPRPGTGEIGRASCRERVESGGGEGAAYKTRQVS